MSFSVPAPIQERTTLSPSFYNHALINNLFEELRGVENSEQIATRDAHALPSYIPARSFALALMDLVGTVPTATPSTDGKPAAPPAPLVTEPLSGAAGATVGPPASITPAQVVVNLPAPASDKTSDSPRR